MDIKQEDQRGLLGNIRILDLADEKASLCSRVMADLGARVLKIEKPGGDPSRKKRPFLNDSRHPLTGTFWGFADLM